MNVGLVQGRGAVRVHRATCRRVRVLTPPALCPPATIAAAVPATCCKPYAAARALHAEADAALGEDTCEGRA